MSDAVTDRVASWLDASCSAEEPTSAWACVEIFGHRKHYGRIGEVERFGAKMLRVDVPVSAPAPLLGEAEKFETFVYGGSAIFSLTPMTEDAARKWATSYRQPSYAMARLPPPEYDDEEE